MRRRDLLGAISALAATGAAHSRAFSATLSTGGAALPAQPPFRALPPEPGAASLNAGLNAGWNFHLGDIPASRVLGHRDSYNNAKAGRARDAAAPDYDDTAWRRLNLPHDWSIELAPVKTENHSQGYRPRGYGWYRRALRLEPALRGRYLELQFGAIATNATVWFNGNIVSHNWSGYNSILIDVTSMARFGSDLNSIVVRVDAERMEGWWYEGAGIYRDTWLIQRAPVHIVTDGVHADPRKAADGSWRLPVAATLYNISKSPAAVEVRSELIDEAGAVVAQAVATTTVPSLGRSVASMVMPNLSPRLWSVENPALYTVRTSVLQEGKAVDVRETTAGFRAIRFDPNEGFFLNDRHLKIQGVCIHQDHAGVGVAVPAALVEWRVRQLKAMGCNAIRSSHNAPDVALLDACDRLGMLVMDENRLFNVSPDYVEQLEWLVRRDRNRPSVILWSVFNEEPIQGTETGFEMVRRMSAVVKALDDSRPVTAAMNGGMFAPINVSQAVDVVGFNYQHVDYDRFHKENPTLPLTSSEDTSGFMTRGEWQSDAGRMVASSYDTDAARWGLTHRAAWKEIGTRPFLAGGFVWTGFDYHGESTPYGWPSKNSSFGAMDLCGFPKTAFYIHQAHWIKDRPILRLEPHWNWAGKEGQSVKVMAITNADHVRLTLNGKRVAEGPVDPYDMATFDIPYQPGRLEMTALKAGKVVGQTFVETTGPAVALRLTPDRSVLIGDGADAQPIMVEAVDARGRPVPTADATVTFRIDGGRIIGLGNGDQKSDEASKGDRQSLFHGLAQVIVQTDAGTRSALRLEATSPGLKSAVVQIAVQPGAIPAAPSSWPTLRVTRWRQSPVSGARPDPMIKIADGDMNSWAPVTAGDPPAALASGGFVLLSGSFKANAGVAARGGRVRFTSIAGRGEVWIDGKLAGRKTDAAAGALDVDLAAGAGDREVRLVLEGAEGDRIGLPGLVVVEGR